MATEFEAWITFAEQIGVFQYVLPFVLTFTILYTVLDKAAAPVFGGNRQSNAVISLVISLFVVSFAPGSISVGTFYSRFFTALAVVLVGVFGAIILFGLVFRDRFQELGDSYLKTLSLIGAIVVAAVFVGVGGLNLLFPAGAGSTDIVPWTVLQDLLGVMLLVGVLVFFYWALGGERGGGEQEPRGQPPAA